jgi:hypothetical protein
MFTGDEVLPYVCALCLDLPVQLLQLFRLCELRGIDLDTSSMNGQQMEYFNKCCKMVSQHLSNHTHVTGEIDDIDAHYSAETMRMFFHEIITKEIAAEVDFEKPEAPATERNKQNVLPSSGACKLCGIDISGDIHAHDYICSHPLMEAILATARDGMLHPDLSRLKQAAAEELLQPPESTRQVKPKPRPEDVPAPTPAMNAERQAKKARAKPRLSEKVESSTSMRKKR